MCTKILGIEEGLLPVPYSAHLNYTTVYTKSRFKASYSHNTYYSTYLALGNIILMQSYHDHNYYDRARGMSSQLVRPKLDPEGYAIKCVGG